MMVFYKNSFSSRINIMPDDKKCMLNREREKKLAEILI